MPLLTEPPVAGTEIDTLLGCLERNRRTLVWKCEGLDATALIREVIDGRVGEDAPR